MSNNLFMENKNKVEIAWLAIERLLHHSLVKNFCIAGGAVRDTLLNKPVRDVDVYIQHDTEIGSAQKLFYRATQDCGFKYVNISNTSYEKDMKISVYRVLHLDSNTSIEFICSPKPVQRVVKEFDIGLCMVYIDSFGNIVETPEFRRDVDNKTLTLYYKRISLQSLYRSIGEHIPKLQEKYSNYRIDLDHKEYLNE